jgi:hypothetical protein
LATIGFIWLGKMGAPMAANLFQLFVGEEADGLNFWAISLRSQARS